MFFDFSNYWMLVAAIAAVYMLVVNFIQDNVGGKGRFRKLQQEMKDVQLKMAEASKSKDEKATNAAMDLYWKQTSELLVIQMQLAFALLVVFFAVLQIFPHFEPGFTDDILLPLFDDGLASHCDIASNDSVFSNCYSLPASGTRGSWVIDAYLNSTSGEFLARNGTAIYYEGGKPEDVWLQVQSQNGLLDGVMGKKAYSLGISTDKANYTSGETVAIRASPVPAVLAQNAKLEANINSGTFFYVDLPFPLPLLNIRRIIGSNGVFIFFAFVLSICFSIAKSIYARVSKK